MQIISLDRDVPEVWLVGPAVEAVRRGELIVLPTDTMYALACDPQDAKAVGRMYAAKGMDKSKQCSVICRDLRDVGGVARAISDECFRFMRSNFPGPFTLVLHAARDLPRKATGKRKTIGVRIPNHPVSEAVAEELGRPLLVTSLPNLNGDDEVDPIAVSRQLQRHPGVVLDLGPQRVARSTVLDFTADPPALLRQGIGDVDLRD